MPGGPAAPTACSPGPHVPVRLTAPARASPRQAGDQAGGSLQGEGPGSGTRWVTAKRRAPTLTSCQPPPRSWFGEPPPPGGSWVSAGVLAGEHLGGLQQVLRHQLHELPERVPHLGPQPFRPSAPRARPRRALRVAASPPGGGHVAGTRSPTAGRLHPLAEGSWDQVAWWLRCLLFGMGPALRRERDARGPGRGRSPWADAPAQ